MRRTGDPFAKWATTDEPRGDGRAAPGVFVRFAPSPRDVRRHGSRWGVGGLGGGYAPIDDGGPDEDGHGPRCDCLPCLDEQHGSACSCDLHELRRCADDGHSIHAGGDCTRDPHTSCICSCHEGDPIMRNRPGGWVDLDAL